MARTFRCRKGLGTALGACCAPRLASIQDMGALVILVWDVGKQWA